MKSKQLLSSISLSHCGILSPRRGNSHQPRATPWVNDDVNLCRPVRAKAFGQRLECMSHYPQEKLKKEETQGLACFFLYFCFSEKRVCY